MSPDEYCQNKAAQSGSSFYYAFLFLPPERRKAITALYAFCREVDDVVDETSEASVARMKLVWWRDQVTDLYEGKASHPVMRALAPTFKPTIYSPTSYWQLSMGWRWILTMSATKPGKT